LNVESAERLMTPIPVRVMIGRISVTSYGAEAEE
jgi:hypothetical protein